MYRNGFYCYLDFKGHRAGEKLDLVSVTYIVYLLDANAANAVRQVTSAIFSSAICLFPRLGSVSRVSHLDTIYMIKREKYSRLIH
jgi:hypothetical protein